MPLTVDDLEQKAERRNKNLVEPHNNTAHKVSSSPQQQQREGEQGVTAEILRKTFVCQTFFHRPMLTQLVSSSTITVAMDMVRQSCPPSPWPLLVSVFSLSRSLFGSSSVFLVWELGGNLGNKMIPMNKQRWNNGKTFIGNIGEQLLL
jgi:hypothetical protein